MPGSVLEVAMTTTPTDLLVRDVIEAQVRQAMADRARLKAGYGTRGRRAELLADINAGLWEWNLLVLGR